jgi:hypothetical protein
VQGSRLRQRGEAAFQVAKPGQLLIHPGDLALQHAGQAVGVVCLPLAFVQLRGDVRHRRCAPNMKMNMNARLKKYVFSCFLQTFFSKIDF